MQLTKQDVLNSEIPSGKILVEILSNNNVKKGGIYLPDSFNSAKDGIVRKIGKSIDNTYYNLNLEKRVPMNVKVGDFVNLNFISDFYKVKVENTTFVIINPTTINNKYNNKYYANFLSTQN